MKKIIKRHPAAKFVQYVAAHVGISFEDMDKDVKDALKKALLNEQGWICGYCCRQLKDLSSVKIEHHCEQSICNGTEGRKDLRLDYRNLMAVCMGHGGKNKFHCDNNKSHFVAGDGLPIGVSPWNQAHINRIRYASSGRIASSDPTHNDEIDRILNLNIDFLKDERGKIWLSIFTECGGVNLNVDKMRRITEALMFKQGDKYPTAYPGLYEYLHKKYVAKTG
jgi:uncharacterized protein (TIGR02646 family)